MQGCKGCTDARPINQCDGCRAGHVIGQSGLHEYEGHGYMTCQAKRYVGADVRPANILGPDEDGLPIARYSYQTGIGMVEHRNGTYVRYGEVELRLRSFKGPEDARAAIYLGRTEIPTGGEAWVELDEQERASWMDTVRIVYAPRNAASSSANLKE